MVMPNPNLPDPEYVRTVQEIAKTHTPSQIRSKILNLSWLAKKAKDANTLETLAGLKKTFGDAGLVKNYMQLKGIGNAGKVLGGVLGSVNGLASGYMWGDAMMNQGASAMGIPQTQGMMENQNQDTLNLQRRQAMLRAQQGGQ